jgi:hypothetical protein
MLTGVAEGKLMSPSISFALGAWGRRKYLETAKRALERLPLNTSMISEVK